MYVRRKELPGEYLNKCKSMGLAGLNYLNKGIGDILWGELRIS